MKRILLFLLLALLLSSCAVAVGEPPDWTDLTSVLVWIATGFGAPCIVAAALSFLVENWDGWSKLAHNIKLFLPMLVSVILSVGAQLLLTKPEYIEFVQPWWTMVIGSVLTWLASQVSYMRVKQSRYGARFRQRPERSRPRD